MKGILKNKGLTLAELMIALVIIGVLAIVSIPLFSTLIKKHRLTGVSESLYHALQYARTEAIKQHVPVVVSFTTGDNWCYGINTNTACNCTTPAACSLGVTSAASTGLTTLSTSGLTGSAITFEPTHAAANAAGVITFTTYGGTNYISTSISRLGNLQMCSNNISGYASC